MSKHQFIFWGLALTLGLSFNSYSAPLLECPSQFDPFELTSNVESYSCGQTQVSSSSLRYAILHTVNEKEFREAELFKSRADLIVGIDITGNSKGHIYVVIDGAERVDGRMFFIKPSADQENWVLSNGLIMRYKHIPKRNKRRLEQWLKKLNGARGLTCVMAGSKIIFDIGDLGRRDGHYWFPSSFLEFLATRGLTDSKGQLLPPETFLINTDFQSFWDNLPRWRNVPTFLYKMLRDPETWHDDRRERWKTKQPSHE